MLNLIDVDLIVEINKEFSNRIAKYVASHNLDVKTITKIIFY